MPARARDAAGVEEPHPFQDFVAGNMRVAMEKEVAGRRMRGRDVFEVHAKAIQLEIQREGPRRFVVAIASDDTNKRDALELHEDLWGTHITQMPDLVRISNALEYLRRKAVVGVGENGDPHERPLLRRAFRRFLPRRLLDDVTILDDLANTQGGEHALRD
jgi:hypothetical protein